MRHLVLPLILIGLLPIAASAASQETTTAPSDGGHERHAAFQEWLKDNPEAAAKFAGKKGDLTPEQRAERREKIKAWLKAHPEIREKLRERREEHGHEHHGHHPQTPATPATPATPVTPAAPSATGGA